MDTVSVRVPARLHLGFLDLNGGLGRKFGSLGLALDRPLTRLSLRRASRTQVSGPEAERAGRLLAKATAGLGLAGHHSLEIEETIPAHAGLGSGTQLALAIAAGLRRLHGLPSDTRADAALLERGARSGIGIGLFDGGGVIVDGGRTPDGPPPPVVARMEFPEAWRIILLFDGAARGVHGPDEIAAFAELPPFPEADAARLCRLVLMRALPALAEHDIAAFGMSVAELQRRLGDHFAPAQGGRYTSKRVADAAGILEREGAHGCGQSSWGPTGFAFAESQGEAERLARALQRYSEIEPVIARGGNRGAVIETRARRATA